MAAWGKGPGKQRNLRGKKRYWFERVEEQARGAKQPPFAQPLGKLLNGMLACLFVHTV